MSEDDYREPKRGRGMVRLVVFIAVLVVLTAAGVFVWKFAFSGPKETDEQTKTYDEPISRLVVEGNSGAVDVVAGEGDSVTVETKLEWRGNDKPTGDQIVSGETLTVKASGCEGIDLFGAITCEVNFRIEVPEDIELDAQVDSGELSTSGVTGAQELHCDSGNITVEGSGKKLAVSADSGGVTGRALNATTVSADVDSGDVELSFDAAPKKAKLTADSGDIVLSVPKVDAGYDVATTVDSGDKTVDVETASGSPHKINADVDSGDVTINYSLFRCVNPGRAPAWVCPARIPRGGNTHARSGIPLPTRPPRAARMRV